MKARHLCVTTSHVDCHVAGGEVNNIALRLLERKQRNYGMSAW